MQKNLYIKWLLRSIVFSVLLFAFLIIQEFHSQHYRLDEKELELHEKINSYLIAGKTIAIPFSEVIDFKWKKVCVGYGVITIGEQRSIKALTMDTSWSLGFVKQNNDVQFYIFPQHLFPFINKSQYEMTCLQSENAALLYNHANKNITLVNGG